GSVVSGRTEYEMAGEGDLRDLLVSGGVPIPLSRRSGPERRGYLALTSAVFSQLAAHRFASPSDVRIEPFLDQLGDRDGLSESNLELCERMIRGVLGVEAELALVPAERRPEIQL